MKTGRVSAASLEEARCKIEAAGLSILGLDEVSGAPAIEIRGVRGSSSPVALRSDPVGQRLSILDSGIEFFEESAKDHRLSKFLWLLSAVGLLVGAYFWLNRPVRAANPIVSTTKVAVKVSAEGTVKVEGEPASVEPSLTIDFPDIQMQIEKDWKELKHPQGPDSYLVDLQLTLLKSPKRCAIIVRRSGYLDAHSDIQELGSESRLHFPLLTLRRQPDRPVTKQTPVGRQGIPARPIVPMKPRPGRS